MKKSHLKFFVAFAGIISILGLLSSTFTAFTSENQWQELEVDPFRFGHNCVTAIDNNIYCIGGRPSPFANFEYPDGHDMLNTQTQEWEKREPIPEVDNPWGAGNVPGGGQTIIDPIAYTGNFIILADLVMLDTHGDGRGPDLVYRAYNISEDSWILFHEDENHPPENFSLTGATTYDGNAYFFGFLYLSEEYYATVYQIDSTLVWERTYQSATPTPEEDVRVHATYGGPISTSYENKIYAFGGHGTQAHANYTKSTYVFDVVDNTWTQKEDMPLLRAHGAAAPNTDGTKIYYFGGDKTPQIMNNDGTDNVQIYKVQNDTWTLSSTYMSKKAQSDHKVAMADGVIYLVLSAESTTDDYEGDRPEIDYYIDETFTEGTEGWGITHFSSLNTTVCPPNYSRCNYHITPGSENTQFPVFTTVENEKKVFLAEDLVGNSLAFLTEGLATEASRVLVTFPEEVFTISGSLEWDDLFVLPKILTEPSAEPDNFSDLGVTIKIGGNVGLTFSRPIRLLIPGEGGKNIGYIDPDVGEFTNIDTVCKADDYAQVKDQLSAGGVCKYNEVLPNEPDNLIIWTTHFTEFVTFEPEESTSKIWTFLRNVFHPDTRCHWIKPDETTWIRVVPDERDGVSGMFVTWTQYSANKVNILIDDGTGSYPWIVKNAINNGHIFLPNVDRSQRIRIFPVNHCREGELSPPVSYDLHPNGWYNIK